MATYGGSAEARMGRSPFRTVPGRACVGMSYDVMVVAHGCTRNAYLLLHSGNPLPQSMAMLAVELLYDGVAVGTA
jgi:hypothetical protein